MSARRAKPGRALLIALAIAIAVLQAPVPARAVDKDSLAQRVQQVRTLVENSSAARKVGTSGNVGAMASRDAARVLIGEAADALAAGDRERASQFATQASRLMFHATQLASAGTYEEGTPSASTIETLINSATSLGAAVRRIGAEQGQPPTEAGAAARIEALLAEAQRAKAAGDLPAANAAARRAYLTAKIALIEMRQGATLIRSLHFDSPADEYRYELDRHDAHRMILGMVAAEHNLDASTAAIVAQSVRESDESRAQAEGFAQHGDHKAAIALLDEATRGLLKAIRRAGLYVPG